MTRPRADLLRGQYLFVEETLRKKLPKDKFYIDELIGCAVVSERGSRRTEPSGLSMPTPLKWSTPSGRRRAM
jgi:hypothetical protein